MKGKGSKTRINREIAAQEVRLIDSEGQQGGVVHLQDALAAAEKAGMDLVEIAPMAAPPVCRVMDYGKYQYQQKKKHKKPKSLTTKEIKFRPVTDDGDYQVKLRNLIRFLSRGDKVKITIRFRGREIAHQELAHRILKRIEVDINEYGAVEQMPKMEGRQVVMLISPKKN